MLEKPSMWLLKEAMLEKALNNSEEFKSLIRDEVSSCKRRISLESLLAGEMPVEENDSEAE